MPQLLLDVYTSPSEHRRARRTPPSTAGGREQGHHQDRTLRSTCQLSFDAPPVCCPRNLPRRDKSGTARRDIRLKVIKW